MNKNIFESHLLSERKLPFIFHLDVQKENTHLLPDMNWHSSVELLYITEGEGIAVCGTQTYPLTKGDLCVISANIPHAFLSSKTLVYHCLIVDESFCASNDIDTENLAFHTLVRDKTAKELYLKITDEFHRSDNFKNAGIRSAVLSLMVYLARNHLEKIQTTYTPISFKDESIKLAIGYIKSHISEKLTLDKIANEAGLSKYYFLREFKKATGETPISFINKTRCEYGKKLLTSGKYSIKEVCERTGFDDMSYFSKNFKKYAGQTPSDYIKQYRKT